MIRGDLRPRIDLLLLNAHPCGQKKEKKEKNRLRKLIRGDLRIDLLLLIFVAKIKIKEEKERQNIARIANAVQCHS